MEEADMTQCALADCDKAAGTRGWCRMHYLRWYRYGNPEYLLPKYATCRIDDCEQVPASTRKGICEKHRARIRKHGDPTVVLPRRRDGWVGYQAAHQRLRTDFGDASDHSCVDCGKAAQHWSYNYQDPEPLIDSRKGLPYSLDSSYYEPRCIGCHNVFDRRAEQVSA